MRIDELSLLTGVTARNIRRYVSLGLVRPPLGRTKGATYTAIHEAELLELRAVLKRDPSLARASEEMKARRDRLARKEELRQGRRLTDPQTWTVMNGVYLTISTDQAIPADQRDAVLDGIRSVLDRARLGSTRAQERVSA